MTKIQPRRMRGRLSWKFALVTTIGVAFVLTVYGFLRVQRETSVFEADIRRDHAAMGHALAVAASAVAARDGPDAAIHMLRQADFNLDRAEIRWTHLKDARTSGPATSHIETIAHRRTLITYAPVNSAKLHGRIELIEPLDAEDAYVHETVIRTVWMTAAVIVLCFLIISVAGWLLLRRPMKQLVDKLERIGRGDLSGPLELRQNDEIGVLAAELNLMCERLDALRRESERQTEQLRHAERLGTVGKLASGIAHELGTPLNVIAARAKIIARNKSAGESAKDDARIIGAQIERITLIIRQLLDFARRTSPKRKNISVRDTCEQTLRLLEPLAVKSGVQLEVVDIPAGLTCDADGGHLQQVLTNLIMNAVQAQPTGGWVGIRAGTVGIGPEQQVTISVEDLGRGMDDQVKKRVFEPFFTTKDVGQGTGLGLSVAYGIVQEHGGWIDVESEPGKGSRFSVHLPRAS